MNIYQSLRRGWAVCVAVLVGCQIPPPKAIPYGADERVQAAKDAARRYISTTESIPPGAEFFVQRMSGEWLVVVMTRQTEGNLGSDGWERDVRMTDPGLQLIQVTRGQ